MELEIGEAALEQNVTGIDSAPVFETQIYSLFVHTIIAEPTEWVLYPWPGDDGLIVEWNQGDGLDSIPTDGLSYEADLSAVESNWIDVDDEIPIDITWPIKDQAFDSGDPETCPLPEPLICELGTDPIVAVAETTVTAMMEDPELATTTSGTLEPQIYYSYYSMVSILAPFIEVQVSPWPSEDGAIADQTPNSSEPESGPLSDPLIGESATDDLVRSDWPLPYMRSVTASPENLRSTDAGVAQLPIGPDLVASPSAMAALPDPAPATATSAGISSEAPVPQPGVDQITGRLADAQPGAGQEVGRNLAAEPAPEITPAPDDYMTPRGRSFQFALESQALLATPRRQESGEAVGTTSEWGAAEGTKVTAPASTRSILLPMSMTGSSVRNPMEAGWGTEGLLAP